MTPSGAADPETQPAVDNNTRLHTEQKFLGYSGLFRLQRTRNLPGHVMIETWHEDVITRHGMMSETAICVTAFRMTCQRDRRGHDDMMTPRAIRDRRGHDDATRPNDNRGRSITMMRQSYLCITFSDIVQENERSLIKSQRSAIDHSLGEADTRQNGAAIIMKAKRSLETPRSRTELHPMSGTANDPDIYELQQYH